MAVIVRPAYGPDETFEEGVDWDIDRDRDLNVYDKPLGEGEPIAVYAAGQWQRVMRDGTPPAST